MKARKRIINKGNIAHANSRAKINIESILERADRLKKDPEKKKRLSESLCKCCYYVDTMRVGGATITQIDCGICDKEMSFSNTCVDVICPECAKKHELCKHCGADIDLKNRRKDYDF